ncbi:flagellar motor protein MotB [Limimaricola pyoseonensis]|uniref:Chemotaxis protein MotB n=1 Tax=Limimaricola pyoseonensis TaxID=521013 RepID=A0A1G7EP76_9RHOB|nr:flagellar motor protein MotB [Limimaricola pyoseonensis]SDE65444.1 chemotaxis protein MotB [Limimaricola pyoseonensis]
MGQGNAPIIVKRKKVVAGDGHHGGAWKVAYADFVTAMMAFFMLMWLLNATTEQQRKGLADYFAPTIAISRTSGGGAQVLDGSALHQTQAMSESGTGAEIGVMGAVPLDLAPEKSSGAAQAAEVAALRAAEAVLIGQGGESLVSREALRHVVTRLTDEGLVIEIFARPGAPIFAPGAAEPLPVTVELLALAAQAAGLVQNPVGLGAHLAARPVVLAENPVWPLSAARADAARRALETGGVAPIRIRRVTGHADRSERIEITLIRTAR